MWIPATKQLTINGSVIVDVGGAIEHPHKIVQIAQLAVAIVPTG